MLQLLNTIDRLATDSHAEDCLSLASVQATSFSKYIAVWSAEGKRRWCVMTGCSKVERIGGKVQLAAIQRHCC